MMGMVICAMAILGAVASVILCKISTEGVNCVFELKGIHDKILVGDVTVEELPTSKLIQLTRFNCGGFPATVSYFPDYTVFNMCIDEINIRRMRKQNNEP